jgi:hypothetical protein
MLVPSCTTSAPSLLAPTSWARHENSFAKGSNETLISPKDQIWQKKNSSSLVLLSESCLLWLISSYLFPPIGIVPSSLHFAIEYVGACCLVGVRNGLEVCMLSLDCRPGCLPFILNSRGHALLILDLSVGGCYDITKLGVLRHLAVCRLAVGLCFRWR